MTNEVNVHLPFPMPVAANASECSLLTLVGAIPHAGCPKVIAEKDEPLNRTCAFLLFFAYPVILLFLFFLLLILLDERARGLYCPAQKEIPKSLAPCLAFGVFKRNIVQSKLIF